MLALTEVLTNAHPYSSKPKTSGKVLTQKPQDVQLSLSISIIIKISF
jgi:hypothetical protein